MGCATLAHPGGRRASSGVTTAGAALVEASRHNVTNTRLFGMLIALLVACTEPTSPLPSRDEAYEAGCQWGTECGQEHGSAAGEQCLGANAESGSCLRETICTKDDDPENRCVTSERDGFEECFEAAFRDAWEQAYDLAGCDALAAAPPQNLHRAPTLTIGP